MRFKAVILKIYICKLAQILCRTFKNVAFVIFVIFKEACIDDVFIFFFLIIDNDIHLKIGGKWGWQSFLLPPLPPCSSAPGSVTLKMTN